MILLDQDIPEPVYQAIRSSTGSVAATSADPLPSKSPTCTLRNGASSPLTAFCLSTRMLNPHLSEPPGVKSLT